MDRSLLEGNPTPSSRDDHRRGRHRATQGVIYVRTEYPLAIKHA